MKNDFELNVMNIIANKLVGVMCGSDSKITVIIPVYNGVEYLSKTLDSLLSQTFKLFDVICVDDCSSDGSMEVLIRYAQADPRIQYLSTQVNLGIVPKVINFARQHVRGDYFVYSSQDDLFSADWLDRMYARAIETSADATLPDVVFFDKDPLIIDHSLVGVDGDRDRIISGRDAFELSLNWRIPGNALWRSSFLHEFGYFDFGMNADEYTARFFFLQSRRVAFSEGVFYYRQGNPNAITKKITLKSFDIPYVEFRLWQLARAENFPKDVQIDIALRSIFRLIYFSSLVLIKDEFGGGGKRYQGVFLSTDVAAWRLFSKGLVGGVGTFSSGGWL